MRVSIIAALRNLEKTFGFCGCMREKLIMDRIILGIRVEETRKKLISQSKLDLEKTIDICRGWEAAARQINIMNKSSSNYQLNLRLRKRKDQTINHPKSMSKTGQSIRKNQELLGNANFAAKCMNLSVTYVQLGVKHVTLVKD